MRALKKSIRSWAVVGLAALAVGLQACGGGGGGDATVPSGASGRVKK